jgi:hypothetical protein
MTLRQPRRGHGIATAFHASESRVEGPQSGNLRHRLLQQLNAPCKLVHSSIGANPSDVAAGPCQARDNASIDWIADDPDNRSRAGGRLKIEHKVVANSDNESWIPTNYQTREVRIRICTSFARISLDQEIAPFDIA